MASLLTTFATMSFSSGRLIALRKERGLTQQGLADAVGIHVQQIKRYEAGSSEPSAEALRKLARTFSVSTDQLLFEEGERTPSDDLALQFEAVRQLSDEERAVIKEVVESLIIKYQTRRSDSPDLPHQRRRRPARQRKGRRRSASKEARAMSATNTHSPLTTTNSSKELFMVRPIIKHVRRQSKSRSLSKCRCRAHPNSQAGRTSRSSLGCRSPTRCSDTSASCPVSASTFPLTTSSGTSSSGRRSIDHRFND